MPAEKLPGITSPFILYVGSAFPHKNLQGLIAAFETLQKTQHKLKLVLVGKKEFYYQELEDIAKAAPSPVYSNIIFTGFVKDSELKWLYQNAKAYVFPSFSEGFGLPGLEAMAHGCPVISSNATCLPEVYQDAAVYFAPSSTKEMAEKIELVLTHPTLADELKIKGHDLLKQYSWEKMARETKTVYEGLLK